MTNAVFALHVSLIARIAAQWSHELVYGMWNADFCNGKAGGVDRFIEEIESRLAAIKGLRDSAAMSSANRTGK
jgi:hypothetical protein